MSQPLLPEMPEPIEPWPATDAAYKMKTLQVQRQRQVWTVEYMSGYDDCGTRLNEIVTRGGFVFNVQALEFDKDDRGFCIVWYHWED